MELTRVLGHGQLQSTRVGRVPVAERMSGRAWSQDTCPGGGTVEHHGEYVGGVVAVDGQGMALDRERCDVVACPTLAATVGIGMPA